MALNDYVHKGEFDRRVKLIEEKLKFIKDDDLKNRLDELNEEYVDKLRHANFDINNLRSDLEEVVGEEGNIEELLNSFVTGYNNFTANTLRFNDVFDTDGQFTGKIRPLSVETAALSVGTRSQQLALNGVEFRVLPYSSGNGILDIVSSTNSRTGTTTGVAGYMFHYGFGTDTDPKVYKINAQSLQISDNNAYYIYAKLPYTHNDVYTVVPNTFDEDSYKTHIGELYERTGSSPSYSYTKVLTYTSGTYYKNAGTSEKPIYSEVEIDQDNYFKNVFELYTKSGDIYTPLSLPEYDSNKTYCTKSTEDIITYDSSSADRNTAIIFIDQNPITLDQLTGYLTIKLGYISAELSTTNSRKERKVDMTYGSTTIDGRLITTGRIEGNGAYFDLDTGDIGGTIKFNDNGTEYDYATYINNKIGNYDLSSNQSFVNAIEDLQDQLDGVVDSYFIDGIPTMIATREPIVSWDDSYDAHKGDTYTDTLPENVNLSELKNNNPRWIEQGFLNASSTNKTYESQLTDSSYYCRTRGLFSVDSGITLKAKSGISMYVVYYDSNKEYISNSGWQTTDISFSSINSNYIYFAVIYANTTNLGSSAIIPSDLIGLQTIGSIVYPYSAHSWKFVEDGSNFIWLEISDSDVVRALAMAAAAQDTADGKRRVFVSTPYVPYDEGDLWANAKYPTDTGATFNNVLLKCKQSKTDLQSFDINDWEPSDRSIATADLARGEIAAAQGELLAIKDGTTTIAGGMITSNLLELKNIINTTKVFDDFVSGRQYYRRLSNKEISGTTIKRFIAYNPDGGYTTQNNETLYPKYNLWEETTQGTKDSVDGIVVTSEEATTGTAKTMKQTTFHYGGGEPGVVTSGLSGIDNFPVFWAGGDEVQAANYIQFKKDYDSYPSPYVVSSLVNYEWCKDNKDFSYDYTEIEPEPGNHPGKTFPIWKKDNNNKNIKVSFPEALKRYNTYIRNATKYSGENSDWTAIDTSNNVPRLPVVIIDFDGFCKFGDFYIYDNQAYYDNQSGFGHYKINLNGSDITPQGTLLGSFYAPTSAGIQNQLLVANASGIPSWKATASGAAYATNNNGALTFGTLPIAQGGTGNTTGTAQMLVGSYTLGGGQQNPNYFGVNKAGALMMNTTVNGNSQYKDWLFMDCYNGNDVGGGVAFGVNRQSLGAYIMRSAAARTSWAESAELIGTHNYTTYTVKKDGTGASGTWGISISGNADTASTLKYNSTIIYGSQGLQMYCTTDSENYGTPVNGTTITNPTDTYYYHLMLNYWNTSGYYLDIAAGMWSKGGNIYYRKVSGGTVYDWVKFLDSENYSSYVLPRYNSNLTAGYIPKLSTTGQTDLANSIIFENSNGIGIGTNSPTYKFDILSNTSSWAIHAFNKNSSSTSPHASFYATHGSGYGMWCGISNNSSSYYIADFRYGTTGDGAGGTSALYVRADGNVGIGNESPAYKLVINDNDSTSYSTNELPAYHKRLLQVENLNNTASSYSSIQIISGTDYASMATLNVINKESTNNTKTIFTIGTRDSSTNITEKLRIDDSGNIGIGTTSPAYKLDVKGDSYSVLRLFRNHATYGSSIRFENNSGYLGNFGYDGSGYYAWTDSSGNNKMILKPDGTLGINTTSPSSQCKLHVDGNIYATGGVTALQAVSSDKRLKKNIKKFKAKDIIDKLNPVSFEWNSKAKKLSDFKDGTNYGLIAQDSDGIIDNLVFDLPDGNGYKGVRYEKLIPILLQAVKEQQKEIDELKSIVK